MDAGLWRVNVHTLEWCTLLMQYYIEDIHSYKTALLIT